MVGVELIGARVARFTTNVAKYVVWELWDSGAGDSLLSPALRDDALDLVQAAIGAGRAVFGHCCGQRKSLGIPRRHSPLQRTLRARQHWQALDARRFTERPVPFSFMPACAALRFGGWWTSISDRDAFESDMLAGVGGGSLLAEGGGDGGY